ncbi:MAG TPA: SpoIIE family protein phosphatase [Bacteroidia bacterium]|jgi:PAS domain S-box-containing protein|nr:SpoIIE family protein phosphatase [Bacteroidia bacterium]
MRTVHEKTIENSGAIVVVVDNDGKAEYVSSSVKDVLGFQPEKLLGEGWFAYTGINSDERENILSHLSGVTSGSSVTVPYERLLRTAWGGQKWILWKTSRADDGKLMGIGYDITERKLKEQQLEKRTSDLADRNREMEASLRYAKRIQDAILPSPSALQKYFSDSFVFYKPKDIVSGDWWWMHETEEEIYVALIDCTGHGVPGALLSVLSHSIFREIFMNKKIRSLSEILHETDQELYRALNHDHDSDPYADGMDVALLRVTKKERKVEFAGAGRPLLIQRGNEMLEQSGDPWPIGFYSGMKKKFSDRVIDVREGDTLFIFSDGYSDQFGGQRNKKLGKKSFRELLLSLGGMSGEEQSSFLEYALHNWKQEEEQTDDITVIGLHF